MNAKLWADYLCLLEQTHNTYPSACVGCWYDQHPGGEPFPGERVSSTLCPAHRDALPAEVKCPEQVPRRQVRMSQHTTHTRPGSERGGRAMTGYPARRQHGDTDPCERGTLYTLGYAQSGAAARLDTLMHQPQVFLLDVRLQPSSRWDPHWNRDALSARFGTRYRWEPRLGNTRYRERTSAITLAPGHQEAIGESAALLCAGRSLVLLCVCAVERGCHRMLVAKLIQDALPTLSSPWEART